MVATRGWPQRQGGIGWSALLAGGLCATAAALLGSDEAFGPLELAVRDAILRFAPARPPDLVTVVAVDDESLARLGPWPWPRPLLAELVRATDSHGAVASVVDILLSDPRPGDESLALVLKETPAVLAVGAGERGWLQPAGPLAASATLAHATFEPDRDGVVRRLPATKQYGSISYPALALAAVQVIDPTRAVPVGVVFRPDFRLAWRELPVIPAWQILAGHSSSRRLRGRIACIGVTAAGLGDRVVLPTSPRGQPMAGVQAHAGAIQCFARGATLARAGPLLAALLTGLWSAAVVFTVRLRPKALQAPALFAAIALPAAFSAVALVGPGWELPLLSPTAAVLVTVLASQRRAVAATRVAAARLIATLGAGRAGDAALVHPESEGLEQLAAAIAARQSAEQEARRVLAHELRTPLTSVRGLTQLLAEYDLSKEERERMAHLAAAEAQRLQDMVEGLIDLERLTLRTREVREPVHLARLVEDCAAVLAASTGRRIDLHLQDHVWVQGDPLALRRGVENLVGNALSYSPAATAITVRVTAERDEAVLSVADRGPGVPIEERQKIFARFGRGAAGAARQGLGLGLALVAEAAAGHGGTVEVTDTPGGGATFIVRLPRLPREGS